MPDWTLEYKLKKHLFPALEDAPRNPERPFLLMLPYGAAHHG
jgi:hypothetical protein